MTAQSREPSTHSLSQIGGRRGRNSILPAWYTFLLCRACSMQSALRTHERLERTVFDLIEDLQISGVLPDPSGGYKGLLRKRGVLLQCHRLPGAVRPVSCCP